MPNSSALVPGKKPHNIQAELAAAQQSLVALAQLYFATQVLGASKHTVDAKRRDLQLFLTFFEATFGHARPQEWFPSVTRAFVHELRGRYRPASVARIYATVRAFARWAHPKFVELPMGSPIDGVQPPEAPEGDWRGVSRKSKLRLQAAAQRRMTLRRRGVHTGTRDAALVAALFGSGLRISELLALDVSQYDRRRRGFTRVRVKGDHLRELVAIGAEARRALDAYLATRPETTPASPLFATRSRRAAAREGRLNRSSAHKVLQHIVREANTHLPETERIAFSAHVARHTLLRELAEEKGIQYAMQQSGHRSDRYIWRYVQPAAPELADALEEVGA